MLEPFFAAFILALISEIGDKTQLVILGLALKYRARFKIFFGAFLAHSFIDGISILVGTFFSFSLPNELISKAVGILFISLGIYVLAKLYIKRSKKNKKEIISKTPFLASFLTIIVIEFGDRSQIASGLLAAKYASPLLIFIGFSLALALVIGLTVFVGSKLAERIPRKTIKVISAILFIVFGLATLLF